jgi:hypothetical protein
MNLNLSAFESTPLDLDPYPHLIVPNFLPAADLNAVARDFPKLDMAGLFAVDDLTLGPDFAGLVEAFEGAELRQAVSRKFGVDLDGLPTFCTLRAKARPKDGKIHADSKFKIITLLLYLNQDWQPDGGRLRVLRSPDDIEDYTAEIPPTGGTLFAFLCTPNAWHGHKPFTGARRALQMNYVADQEVRHREHARHRFSGRMKRLGGFLGLG